MDEQLKNELILLKSEVYDANKAVNNLNAILARVASIAGVKDGGDIQELFNKLETAFSDNAKKA